MSGEPQLHVYMIPLLCMYAEVQSTTVPHANH